jgi:hypothetical protein
MSEGQLSSRDAAAYVGLPPSSWRVYVARGEAPAPDGKIGNSNWWWRDTLDKWKQEREAKS